MRRGRAPPRPGLLEQSRQHREQERLCLARPGARRDHHVPAVGDPGRERFLLVAVQGGPRWEEPALRKLVELRRGTRGADGLAESTGSRDVLRAELDVRAAEHTAVTVEEHAALFLQLAVREPEGRVVILEVRLAKPVERAEGVEPTLSSAGAVHQSPSPCFTPVTA